MTSVGARSRLRSQPRRANGLAAASRLASFSDGGGDRLRAGGARAASRAAARGPIGPHRRETGAHGCEGPAGPLPRAVRAGRERWRGGLRRGAHQGVARAGERAQGRDRRTRVATDSEQRSRARCRPRAALSPDPHPCSHIAARFCQRVNDLRRVESTSIDPGLKSWRPTACRSPAVVVGGQALATGRELRQKSGRVEAVVERPPEAATHGRRSERLSGVIALIVRCFTIPKVGCFPFRLMGEHQRKADGRHVLSPEFKGETVQRIPSPVRRIRKRRIGPKTHGL